MINRSRAMRNVTRNRQAIRTSTIRKRGYSSSSVAPLGFSAGDFEGSLGGGFSEFGSVTVDTDCVLVGGVLRSSFCGNDCQSPPFGDVEPTTIVAMLRASGGLR